MIPTHCACQAANTPAPPACSWLLSLLLTCVRAALHLPPTRRGLPLLPAFTACRCDHIVDDFGIYVLMVKPPGAKDYVCCYLGKAGPAPGQFSMETVKQK